MKKVLVFLLVLTSFTACKKEVDPQPEPEKPVETPAKGAAAAVAGTYKLASFNLTVGKEDFSLPTLPQVESGKTVAAGTTQLKAAGADAVSMDFVLKIAGSDDLTFDLDEVEVKKVGKVYGLFVDNVRIGDADGSNIIFNMTETDSDTGEKITVRFTAKK